MRKRGRSAQVANKSSITALKLDPTRTTTLRQEFRREVRRRFAKLKLSVLTLLKDQQVLSRDWAFGNLPEKVEAFQNTLDRLVNQDVFGLDEWWTKYLLAAYLKGVYRAYDDTMKPAMRDRKEYAVAKAEFARTLLLQKTDKPQVVLMNAELPQGAKEARSSALGRRMQALSGKVRRDLKSATDVMTTRMANVLQEGLDKELDSSEIAVGLSHVLDTVGRLRSELTATTELTRAFSDAQLDALENLGVEEITFAVEWIAREGMCKACAPMDGVVLTLSEARGMVPRHPNCKCSVRPVGTRDVPLKTSRSQVVGAIKKSLAVTDDILEDWSPGAPIAKERPELP
jgi:hypothetical protein